MTSVQPVQLAYKKYEPDSEVDENLAPIIFQHSTMSSKECWGDCPQIVANATKRKVYAVDARNHGDTEGNDVWNYDVNAIDLIHFINSHGIRKAILVGHSMGGITSIKVALQRPDLVEKIVVEDMFVRKLPKEILLFISSFISILRNAIDSAPPELDEDGVKKYVMEKVFQSFPPERTQKKDDAAYKSVIALRRDSNGRYKFKANFEVIARVLTTDPENIMTENHGVFEGPALFIYGKLSEFKVGDDEPHIRQHFPNAVFKGIEGASHSVYLDKPVEYVDELLKFLS